MTIKLEIPFNKKTFTIDIDGPTEEELALIDGPNIEGQTTVEEVWIDEQLAQLQDALRHMTYSFTILE